MEDARSGSDGAEEVDWVVPDLIGRSLLTLLVAKPKVGKTQMLLGLVHAGLKGSEFLGRSVDFDAVLYLSEQSRTTLADQMARAGRAPDACDCSRSPWSMRFSTSPGPTVW